MQSVNDSIALRLLQGQDAVEYAAHLGASGFAELFSRMLHTNIQARNVVMVMILVMVVVRKVMVTFWSCLFWRQLCFDFI
jgi:hypothetical protein